MTAPSSRPSSLHHAGWATLVALRSTGVILALPLLALVVRDHGWKWHELRKVVIPNYPFAAMVFLGVWIWGFWFRRTARRESSSGLSSRHSAGTAEKQKV